MKQETAA